VLHACRLRLLLLQHAGMLFVPAMCVFVVPALIAALLPALTCKSVASNQFCAVHDCVLSLSLWVSLALSLADCAKPFRPHRPVPPVCEARTLHI
jgi:hypothetical protein